MNRRRFLAAGVAGGVLPLAGCPARRTELRSPETRREADETHLIYRDADERVAVFSYLHRQRVARPPPYGLRVTVSHSRSTTIDDVRIELDTAPGERPKPDVYLRTPEDHPYPEIHYHTDVDTGAAVLDAPDTGGRGIGTMTFQFLVAPPSEDRQDPVGETSVTLTGRRFVGRTYELSDRTGFELRPDSG